MAYEDKRALHPELYSTDTPGYDPGVVVFVLTSNLGFAGWGDMFGNPVMATALLDRLLHHSIVFSITCNRYRLRDHMELDPGHIRAR